MSIVTLRIENMHCGSCIRRVMQTLNSLPGTHAQEVRMGRAQIKTGDGSEDPIQALANAGFPAQVETTEHD